MAKGFGYAAQAVVPAMPATNLDTQSAEGQIDFVMHNNQIPRGHSEGLTGGSHTCPATIHKGLGKKHCSLFPNQTTDSVNPLIPLAFEGDTGAGGQANRYHDADIVTRLRIPLARIAQADNQFQNVDSRGLP